jgi:hypothetical protein
LWGAPEAETPSPARGEEKPENTVLDWNFLARMGQVSIGGMKMQLENFGG